MKDFQPRTENYGYFYFFIAFISYITIHIIFSKSIDQERMIFFFFDCACIFFGWMIADILTFLFFKNRIILPSKTVFMFGFFICLAILILSQIMGSTYPDNIFYLFTFLLVLRLINNLYFFIKKNKPFF